MKWKSFFPNVLKGISAKMIRVYKSGIHRGEEQMIFGNENSGMINFSGCHLSCRFCYTPETSRVLDGEAYTSEKFYALIQDLVRQGAKNINLITPSHLWSALKEPLNSYKQSNLPAVPVIVKTGGSEPIRLVKTMLETADVWLPDLKIWDSKKAVSAGLPAHYGPITLEGIQTATEVLKAEVDSSTHRLKRGVLVRHLLMPDFESDTKEILKQLSQIRFNGFLNLMTQFIHPIKKQLIPYPKDSLNRLIQKATDLEIKILINGKSQLNRGNII
jgi:putative pyruvate formate lyase activating enzyme